MMDKPTAESKSDASPPTAVASVSAPAMDLFAGGGEMGAIMRSTDWSKTKLGPVEDWPKSLQNHAGRRTRQPVPHVALVGPRPAAPL